MSARPCAPQGCICLVVQELSDILDDPDSLEMMAWPFRRRQLVAPAPHEGATPIDIMHRTGSLPVMMEDTASSAAAESPVRIVILITQ